MQNLSTHWQPLAYGMVSLCLIAKACIRSYLPFWFTPEQHLRAESIQPNPSSHSHPSLCSSRVDCCIAIGCCRSTFHSDMSITGPPVMGLPEGGRTLIYSTVHDHDIKLDYYLPPTASGSPPALIYFHGGGMASGPRRDKAFPQWLYGMFWAPWARDSL